MKKIIKLIFIIIIAVSIFLNCNGLQNTNQNDSDSWYQRDEWLQWDNNDEGIKTFYVSKTGSDTNNGLSETRSLLTITKAISLAAAGDTIIVKPGVYEEHIILNKNGEPGKWITLKAHPDFMAKDISKKYGFDQRENYGVVITGTEWSACAVDVRASYVKVKGFFITCFPAGGSERYDVAVRLRDSSNSNFGGKPKGQPYNHIIISENVIYGGGESGITGGGVDFVYLRNNIIFQNSSPGFWMGSGISLGFVYNPMMPFNDPNDKRFHYVVEGNICYGNSNYWIGYQKKILNSPPNPYPELTGKGSSDGNGIIIDWAGNISASRSLVRNNIVYNNGQRGICLTYSSNAVVINNTIYDNAWDPYYNWDWGHQGEIADVGGIANDSSYPFSGQCGVDRNIFVNNIIFTKTNGRYRGDAVMNNSRVYSDYNFYYNGGFGNALINPDNNLQNYMNKNDRQGLNPMFVNAPALIANSNRFSRPSDINPVDPVHWYSLNFSLRRNSPVIGLGYNTTSTFNTPPSMPADLSNELKYFLDKALPSYDIFGNKRDPLKIDPGAVAFNTRI